MYSVHLDDDVAEGIKEVASDESRSVRGQINYYLRNALKSDGVVITGTKKADDTVESNTSASTNPPIKGN